VGHLERNAAPHAEANDVSTLDLEGVEKGENMIRMSSDRVV
jgi:hypothetical protein